MSEDKIEIMTQLMKKTHQCEQEQKIVIKHLVELQTSFASSGMDHFAEKMGEAFALDSKVEENLKKLAHNLDLEVNRLKNEAA